MKFKFKKYIYFVNDITNVILKKDREQMEEHAHKLRHGLILVGVLFIISFIVNIILLIKL